MKTLAILVAGIALGAYCARSEYVALAWRLLLEPAAGRG